jgi:hypothetical protein
LAHRQFRPKYELTVRKIPEPMWRLLQAAAQRRRISPSPLALMMIGGVLYHGSIHRTINGVFQDE